MRDELDDFEGLEEEFDGMEDEYMDEVNAEIFASFVKTASKSATKLAALIVDNNRHNDIKMTSSDIYNIYSESFAVAMATIVQTQEEE